MDRYVLSVGDENVITLSMDVAIPGFPVTIKIFLHAKQMLR